MGRPLLGAALAAFLAATASPSSVVAAPPNRTHCTKGDVGINWGLGGKAASAADAGACCALCFAIPSCGCWDYDTASQGKGTNCWYDKPDCHTKQINQKDRVSGRLFPSGPTPAPTPSGGNSTATVTIDGSKAIGKTALGHMGLVFDGYTTDVAAHDPLRTAAWANSNWVQANFSDPVLRGWVKALVRLTRALFLTIL